MTTMKRQQSLFNLPLFIALATTFVAVFVIERGVWSATGGVFMYPLDDPFIHMQIARNLAFFHTWGINPQEFASASSSLLYTLILTVLFKLFSIKVWLPFLINCIAAIFLLAVVDGWLRRQQLGAWPRGLILCGLVFLIPLPVMIISGMEHTLQCLFCFLFLTRFASWLEDGAPEKKIDWPLMSYGILVVALRYEGLFLVGLAGLMLLYYRQWKTAFLMGGIALLPVIIFGIFSLAHGSYFLPNSVLVKSEGLTFSLKGLGEYIGNILVNKLTVVKTQVKIPGSPPPGISLLAAQRLLLILPLTYLSYRGALRRDRQYTQILILLTGVTVLHLALAATGWFYRYEAYLLLCTATIVSAIVWKYGKGERGPAGGLAGGDMVRPVAGGGDKLYTRLFAGLLLFALFFPFVLRSAAAWSNAKQACINIYQQQYQMGQFLKKYDDKEVIAANDIGAISYYSDIRIVDLWGLGSIDVARSKKGKYWTAPFLDSLVRKQGVKLALVYDEWFDPALLKQWTKVGTWTIHNNVICGGDTVSFYAIDPRDAAVLRENMEAYRQVMPAEVDVKTDYEKNR